MNDTQKIELSSDGLESMTARISAKNKDFIERYAKGMHRSVAEQVRQILDKFEAGEIEVIAYELRNIGVDVKAAKK
jgi:hypothetical protein